MSRLSGIPIVKRESSISKFCKMNFCIILIIVILIYMISNSCDDIKIVSSNKYLKTKKENFTSKYEKNIVGKYLQIYSDVEIPLNEIIVINNNRLINIFNDFKKINLKNKFMFQVNLPTEIIIDHIILHIDILNEKSKNLHNTRVVIRNNKYEIIWENKYPLDIHRYTDVNIYNKPVILPKMQKLCSSDTKLNQEKKLYKHLIENTFY